MNRDKLKEPDPEDIRKLHQEINQIINQRFTLTTLSITVFGVIVSLMIPKEAKGLNMNSVHALSILLSIVLGAIYYYSCQLLSIQHILVGYLLVYKKSHWQEAWKKGRSKDGFIKIGTLEAQQHIFFIFITIGTVFPFSYYRMHPNIHLGVSPFTQLGSVFVYLVVAVFIWTFTSDCFYNSKDIEQKWRDLLEIRDDK